MHGLAAQIEEAVAQPGLLGKVALGVDLQRQRLGRRFHDQGLGDQLDLAGREPGVDRLLAARHDPAGDRQHALQPDGLGLGEERVLGLEHDLGDAVVVAQVDEQQLAVIALAVDPPGQPDLLADVGRAQLAAVVGAIGMHRAPVTWKVQKWCGR